MEARFWFLLYVVNQITVLLLLIALMTHKLCP